MRERTSDMYRIQEENVATEGDGPKYNNRRGFDPRNEEDLVEVKAEEVDDQQYVKL
jgi:hypothetical protein